MLRDDVVPPRALAFRVGAIRMELEGVPEGRGFFVGGRDEEEFHLHFEFAPASFGDRERGDLDHSGGVGVGFVELELHFFEPVGYVFIVDSYVCEGVGSMKCSRAGTVREPERMIRYVPLT